MTIDECIASVNKIIGDSVKTIEDIIAEASFQTMIKDVSASIKNDIIIYKNITSIGYNDDLILAFKNYAEYYDGMVLYINDILENKTATSVDKTDKITESDRAVVSSMFIRTKMTTNDGLEQVFDVVTNYSNRLSDIHKRFITISENCRNSTDDMDKITTLMTTSIDNFTTIYIDRFKGILNSIHTTMYVNPVVYSSKPMMM